MEQKQQKRGGATVDSIFLTVVKVVSTLSAIVQTKILSVGLSLTDNGTYSQTSIIISIMASILLLGFGDAINYFFNSRSSEALEQRRTSIVNTVFGLELIFGIVLAIVLVLGSRGVVSYFSNEQLAPLLIIIAIRPMIENMLTFFQVLFVSVGKAKLIAIRNLIVTLSKLVITYLTVMIFNSLALILTSLLILDLLQLLLFSVMFKKNAFLVNPLGIKKEHIKPILKYSLPMGLYAFTATLTRDTDRLIIGFLCNTEELAIYNNCSKVLPFDIISISFATVLIPFIMKYVSSKNYDASKHLVKNYFKIGYYSAWILGGAVLSVASQAICFLYSSEYLSGQTVFILYIFDSMIKFASMHLVITANGDTNTIMIFSLISLFLNIVLNLLMFKLVGFIGPAIATLIVSLLYTVAIIIKTKKILNAKITELFDLKDISMVLIITGIQTVAFAFIDKWLLNKGLNPTLVMFIVMISFGLLSLLIWWRKIKSILKETNSFKM